METWDSNTEYFPFGNEAGGEHQTNRTNTMTKKRTKSEKSKKLK